jgi:HK97 family phage portal protein
VGIIDLEAATKRSAKAKPRGGPRNLSMAWDDTMLGGLAHADLLDDREKKKIYREVYKSDQWVSGCVNTIANRITSGGWECVELEKGKGKKGNKKQIESLLDLENLEEDFDQVIRSIIKDVLVFGEGFCELGYTGNTLTNLYMIDGISMTARFDKHGQITGYTQRLEKSTDTVSFEPHEIIRWWLPDLEAKKKALSPIELLKDPVWLSRSMTTWGERFFRQGGKPSYWVEMGPDSTEEDGDRYLEWFKENYTGIENAHIPPVMYGGGKIHEFGRGSIELDFDKSEDKQRTRTLVVYGVPPAMLNIIETATLGGGTGDSQNKSFIYNTAQPIERLVMAPFNYRIIKRGMGITDWKVQMRHADYRDDKDVAEVEDKSVKNGTLTINEARQERGRESIAGGDVPIIITKDITPVARLATLEQEQAQQAELSMQGAKTAMQRLQQGDQEKEPNGQNKPASQGDKGKVQAPDQETESTGQDQREAVFRDGSEDLMDDRRTTSVLALDRQDEYRGVSLCRN